MSRKGKPPLDLIGDHLARHRKAILSRWRKAADADPGQTTAHALTRGQFNDHIPEVLDAFERDLRARPGGGDAAMAERETKAEEVKHGLHRWQQGYRLQELMREWGQLQLCLFDVLEDFAAAHPGMDRTALVDANRRMIMLVNEAISESTAQYERLQQAKAAGQVEYLTSALASVSELERRRAALIHEAVHDLGSNVFGVTVAANQLGAASVAGAERAEFASVLKHGVQGITAMLGELMELARLEAGQETREISRFNAATLVTGLCRLNQPFARERSLLLEGDGPRRLWVEGDPLRVRRLMQNLVLNALKYTHHGGVFLGWGAEKKSWWLLVRDTGPGLKSGAGAALADGLEEATASAREADEKTAACAGETSRVLAPSGDPSAPPRPTTQQPGEGIGLSIVKRLCELLDASLEMTSAEETGTTFRIVLPRRY